MFHNESLFFYNSVSQPFFFDLKSQFFDLKKSYLTQIVDTNNKIVD